MAISRLPGNVLFTSAEIAARVSQLGQMIRVGVPQEESSLLLVGVMTGALPFLADLARSIPGMLEIGLVRAKSYGDGTESSGAVDLDTSWLPSLAGKTVVLVDDILDTGRTLQTLCAYMEKAQVGSVRTCVLLDKPARRKVDFQADLVGWTIPDHFVVGYGLDHAGQWRQLREIRVLEAADLQEF